MGYSTCGKHGKRTCDLCDSCSRCEGDRQGIKIGMHVNKCPAGWCAPTYICPTCKTKHAEKIKTWHDKCSGYVAKVAEQEAAQQNAIESGQPVIKAGVFLPGRETVFAWTTQGNYEVLRDIYDAGLQRIDHVLDLSGAVRRYDETPAEVYHQAA